MWEWRKCTRQFVCRPTYGRTTTPPSEPERTITKVNYANLTEGRPSGRVPRSMHSWQTAEQPHTHGRLNTTIDRDSPNAALAVFIHKIRNPGNSKRRGYGDQAASTSLLSEAIQISQISTQGARAGPTLHPPQWWPTRQYTSLSNPVRRSSRRTARKCSKLKPCQG